MLLSSKRHSIETSEQDGVRFLHFGSEWVQGAMRIARPWALELEYTRDMAGVLLLRHWPDWPLRVLQVGLGAASLTKFIYRHCPLAHQTIVEINPDVIPVARQSFKLPDDPQRITLCVADAVEWITRHQQRFDCIFVDGFDENARFGALGSEAFYRACRDHLGADGILVLNLFGRTRGYRRQISGLENVFGPHVKVLPPVEGGNAIAFGSRSPLAVTDAELHRRGQQLQHVTGLPLAATMARLRMTN